MNKETLLYVDDENINIETFVTIFENDYNILTANSAQSALEIISKNPLIKIIISDLKMPEMNGLELFEIVNRQNPEIICIILTGHFDIDDTLKAINQGGIYRYILKPFKNEEIKHTIDNALETFNLKLINKTLINNLRRKNEALHENEEKFKNLIEFSPTGYILTKDEQIVLANASFIKLMGFNNFEEIKNLTIPEIFNSDEIALAIENNSENKEFKIINNKGLNKIMLINSSEIELEKQKHFQTTFFDITQLRDTQNRLIEAKEKVEKADRLKTAFLANISHEIRTPLNGIIGFSSLICDLDTSEKEKKEYYEIIRTNSDYLVNTINDIIEISKANSDGINIIETPTNVLKTIYSVKNDFEKEINFKKLKFEIIENNKISIIITDDIIFKKIIFHIISNAVKFTEKGKISIEYFLTDDNKYVEFSVEDTGIGIQENELDFIFDTFYQLDNSPEKKYPGAGLGLALANSYIKKLGGRIWVSSKSGEGSNFRFTIPYITEKNNNTIITNQKIKIKTVLIADDEEVNLFYLEKALNKINIETIKASNGLEVIDFYKNNPGIDAILMDIKMPKLDGIKALEEIRKLNKTIFVVALTAFTEEKNRSEIMHAGFDYYLEKPINRKELTDLLKDL